MSNFTTSLLTWFDAHGRKDLPWQKNISPYSVWVSEIMLQQTQVTTVIPYFEKFLSVFPNIKTLADAELDDVLHLWTGLGYYARARNLYKTAKIVTYDYHQHFPDHLEEIILLPGIGKSTAGAILSIAFQKATPILDGNVKRVLCRYHTIMGHPAEKEVVNTLWQLASKYTSTSRCADYTQAIMDLGATICTRSKPKCSICPISSGCSAYKEKKVAHFPQSKRKSPQPVKKTHFLIMKDKKGNLLLEKRPLTGLWGGLWGFPEYSGDNFLEYCSSTFNCDLISYQRGELFRHTFSHFHLDITPVFINVEQKRCIVMDENWMWHSPQSLPKVGFAAPVKKLLQNMD